MSTASGYEQFAAILLAQIEAEALFKGETLDSQINNNIKDCPPDATYEFRLRPDSLKM
jgi:hypothetical protein